MRETSRHVHERPDRGLPKLVAEPEPEGAFEHVQRLVLVRVDVEGRALARRDFGLEDGQRFPGLDAAHLEGDRPAYGFGTVTPSPGSSCIAAV